MSSDTPNDVGVSGAAPSEFLNQRERDLLVSLKRRFSVDTLQSLCYLCCNEDAGNREAPINERKPNDVVPNNADFAEQPEASIAGFQRSALDSFLFRFLKARQFDVSLAEAMLRNYLRLRFVYKVQNICEVVRFPWIPQLRQVYPHGYHGVDRFGRPVYIERLGQVDITKVLEQVPIKLLTAYWVQHYEYLQQVILPACSIAAGRRVEQSLTILDLSGLAYSRLFVSQLRKTLRWLAKLTQTFYPELLGSMLIVNPPTLFTPLWSFLKTLLDPVTVSKIKILAGSHSKSWQQELLGLVAADQLPEFLGGTKPDKLWTSNNFGPWRDPAILQQLEQHYPSKATSFVYLDVNYGDENTLAIIDQLPDWCLDETLNSC